MLRALDSKAQPIVKRLNQLMLDSISQIKRMNAKYNTSADMIWLWSPSDMPRIPSFTHKFGMRGAIVAGLDFMRGIGVAAGMETKEIHGATGYLDSNLKQKLKYAINFLQRNSLVYIHVNAPDEEAHAHNVENKILAIERIEREIVGPLVDFLESRYPDNYRMIILPDHYTRLVDGQHTSDPVPYLVYGDGVEADEVTRFDEKSICEHSTETIKSYEFMNVLQSLPGGVALND
jgi:2,3-bisphosphoglycerate-independent phosphoglycerate mutase